MAEPAEEDKQMWKKRGKMTIFAIIVAGIGFLVGLYIVAPMQAKSESYVPKPVKQMETSIVTFRNPAEGDILLPVKVADSSNGREQGLNQVGQEALENTYLLYDQEDVSSWSETYDVSGVTAAISFAVLDGDGKVIEIKEAKPTDDSLSVDKDHRWVLAVKKGLLNKFGIKKGSELSKESLPGTQ